MIAVGVVIRGDRGILWTFAGFVLVLVGGVGLVMWAPAMAGRRRAGAARVIRAAGAILHRDGAGGRRRTAPSTTTGRCPKGKLDPGEDEPEAAVREVEEETGHVGVIEHDLGTIGYDVAAGPKTVRYYLMAADAGGAAARRGCRRGAVGGDRRGGGDGHVRPRPRGARAGAGGSCSREGATSLFARSRRRRPMSNPAKSANFPLAAPGTGPLPFPLRRPGQPSRSKPGGRAVEATRKLVRPGDERPAGAANLWSGRARRTPPYNPRRCRGCCSPRTTE